jgi:hypothetical protein
MFSRKTLGVVRRFFCGLGADDPVFLYTKPGSEGVSWKLSGNRWNYFDDFETGGMLIEDEDNTDLEGGRFQRWVLVRKLSGSSGREHGGNRGRSEIGQNGEVHCERPVRLVPKPYGISILSLTFDNAATNHPDSSIASTAPPLRPEASTSHEMKRKREEDEATDLTEANLKDLK